MNTKSIKIHLVGSKYTNTKNFKFEKSEKKVWPKTKKEQISLHNSSHNFA